MRVKLSRLLCVSLFFLIPHLFMQGCSSSQQEDEISNEEYSDQEGNEEYSDEEGYEDQEGYDDQEDGNEYSENQEGDGEDYAEEGEEYENYDAYGDEEGEELVDNQLGNNIIDGEETKSDLEDIIAGQDADAAEEIPADVTDDLGDSGAGAEMASAGDMGAPATPGVSAGPALPEMGAKMPYVVRVGETLSSISQKIYGNSEKTQEMAELTSLSNPDLIKPGDVVYYQLTDATAAFASAYEGASKEMVTVQPGDTLAGIAQRVYGAAGDWKFIWRQNGEISNPDRLEVGQSLYYVSPSSLTAAINKLKDMTIAELIEESFDLNEEEDSNANTTTIVDVDQIEAPVTLDNNVETENAEVSGFQIARGMFNVFATNFGMAG